MNLKVKRTEKLKTDLFNVGDVVSFRTTTGEKVEMLAVKSEFDGMIFCSVDCMTEESYMNESGSSSGVWNESDLRAKLNGEILSYFPVKISSKLVPFKNGDYIRIPTEKEVFGENVYGEDEPDSVKQWEPMKWRRNRIALQGLNGAWEWYWLQNPAANSADCFAGVNSGGVAACNGASAAGGVRPVVKIKNPISAPACQVRDDEDEQES